MMALLKADAFDETGGRYGSWTIEKLEDGSTRVLVCCPTCGLVGGLGNHNISSKGVVTPKLRCAREGCGFKDEVKLLGWKAP
jgi:hypothetical protein